jgi:hypothetical protein
MYKSCKKIIPLYNRLLYERYISTDRRVDFYCRNIKLYGSRIIIY